jgi:hypothetical protein
MRCEISHATKATCPASKRSSEDHYPVAKNLYLYFYCRRRHVNAVNPTPILSVSCETLKMLCLERAA